MPPSEDRQTILEGIGSGEAISRDYQNRLNCFWDVADRWSRPLRKARDYDNALCDWADFAYLEDEGKSEGEKLLAALRVLRNWRQKAPRQSRLPMPGLYTRALACCGCVQNTSSIRKAASWSSTKCRLRDRLRKRWPPRAVITTRP